MRKARTKAGPEYKFNITQKSSQSYIIANHVSYINVKVIRDQTTEIN
jgi:hypothetical protein